jgi:hypothetical protein
VDPNGEIAPCIFYIPEYAAGEVVEVSPADEELLAALHGYI